jgi:ATP-dependent DNA helicase RecG
MLKTELAEIIRNGENSGVEFKRDHDHVDSLAKEIVALLNLEGGYILLGVEDNGAVSGLTRTVKSAEEWVMDVCRQNIQPAIIPYWETATWDEARMIGIVTLPADSPDKPYKAKRGSAWVTFVRVGSTSREAIREEEARLYQAAHLMRYDIKAVSGTGLQDLDMHRIENYFRDILGQSSPPLDDQEAWTKILLNTDLRMMDRNRAITTVAGLLLFGNTPNRYLPQAGITATAYPGAEKEYATVDEEVIRGPLVSLFSPKTQGVIEPGVVDQMGIKTGAGSAAEGDYIAGEENTPRLLTSTFATRGRVVVDTGVIDRAVGFVVRNMGTTAWLEGAQRRVKGAFPIAAVREAVVNAVVHRDYTMALTDVELSLYSDRLEIISPGRLPNTVTVEKMKQGYRAARNELLKETLRDYGYVEYRGMGVRNRIIQGMREHNGTDPDLIEEESRFIVRLWKEKKA